MAVPGPVTSAASTGCHRMIRDDEARLVTSARDVVEEAGPIGVDDVESGDWSRPIDALSGDKLAVYEALPGSGARSPRELSESSGVVPERVRAVLTLLELDGYVGSDDTGWFRRR